jgi:hypothetical protein
MPGGFSMADPIPETSGESKFAVVNFPQTVVTLGLDENGKDMNSDTLTISAFQVKLFSDGGDSGVDASELFGDTINISATSCSCDVPEPSAFVLFSAGLIGLFPIWWVRRHRPGTLSKQFT